MESGRICSSKDFAQPGGAPLTLSVCPQQTQEKQEESLLCCFSVGLHPTWSFEGFIQCVLIVKSSQALWKQRWGLGPAMWMSLGWHLGTCMHSLQITETCWEQGKIFQGAEVCSQQQNSTAEVTLYLTPYGGGCMCVCECVCVCARISQENKPRYYWCLLLQLISIFFFCVQIVIVSVSS